MDCYRFFAEQVEVGTVTLPADQAHHAQHVLRLESGAEVEVFDGRGGYGRGRLTMSKRGASVEVMRVEREPAVARQLTLATAVPKGERAEWLIEQASQLGVAVVQWLACERGVVKPKEGSGKMEKFRRLAIESAKQCGRNYLLEVRPLRSVEEVVREALAGGEEVWWLEPREGMGLGEALGGGALRVSALIGPEGGWSPRETAWLEQTAGIKRVRLTGTILRIETACAAVAAVVGMSF